MPSTSSTKNIETKDREARETLAVSLTPVHIQPSTVNHVNLNNIISPLSSVSIAGSALSDNESNVSLAESSSLNVALTGSSTGSTAKSASKAIKNLNVNEGRWTKDEHEQFVRGLEMHGKEWKKIAALIPTRTIVQIRTHAQKFFQKVAKMSFEKKGIEVPEALKSTAIKTKYNFEALQDALGTSVTEDSDCDLFETGGVTSSGSELNTIEYKEKQLNMDLSLLNEIPMRSRAKTTRQRERQRPKSKPGSKSKAVLKGELHTPILPLKIKIKQVKEDSFHPKYADIGFISSHDNEASDLSENDEATTVSGNLTAALADFSFSPESDADDETSNLGFSFDRNISVPVSMNEVSVNEKAQLGSPIANFNMRVGNVTVRKTNCNSNLVGQKHKTDLVYSRRMKKAKSCDFSNTFLELGLDNLGENPVVGDSELSKLFGGDFEFNLCLDEIPEGKEKLKLPAAKQVSNDLFDPFSEFSLCSSELGLGLGFENLAFESKKVDPAGLTTTSTSIVSDDPLFDIELMNFSIAELVDEQEFLQGSCGDTEKLF